MATIWELDEFWNAYTLSRMGKIMGLDEKVDNDVILEKVGEIEDILEGLNGPTVLHTIGTLMGAVSFVIGERCEENTPGSADKARLAAFEAMCAFGCVADVKRPDGAENEETAV